MEQNQDLIQSFIEAAQKVSAVVSQVSDITQAFSYVVELCDGKQACQLLVSGCAEHLSTQAEDMCRRQEKKVIAAPLLKMDEAAQLKELCEARGIRFVRQGLRDHLPGIDIGFTMANYGIAETGTLVIDSSDEELRLATMLSEIHVAVLPTSRLRSTALELEMDLGRMMDAAPHYCSFITGASRTADIERVLALGVHGPLELHILLLEA